MSDSSKAAGFVPLDAFVVCHLTGRDRTTWLQGFCTADLRDRQPGTGCESFVLNVKGRTLAHVLILIGADRIVLIALGHPEVSLAAHFERYIIREDVTVEDVSARSRLWWATGPDESKITGCERDCSPWSHWRLTQSLELVVAPVTGPGDWLLMQIDGTPDEAEAWLSGVSLEPVAHTLFEQRRIDTCWPINGIDLGSDNFPQEFRRNERTISFDKGCYLGQETVARIDALGHVNRFLMRFSLTGESGVESGTSLYRPGEHEKPAGHITSSATGNENDLVALAFVRRQLIKSNAIFEFEGGQARLLDDGTPIPLA